MGALLSLPLMALPSASMVSMILVTTADPANVLPVVIPGGFLLRSSNLLSGL